jgi:hypothetical protein
MEGCCRSKKSGRAVIRNEVPLAVCGGDGTALEPVEERGIARERHLLRKRGTCRGARGSEDSLDAHTSDLDVR